MLTFDDVVNRRAKTHKSARWHSDQSESEEEASSDEASVPDPSEKATSPRRSSSVVSDTGPEEDGGEPSEREKKFGRKARVKAQVSHFPSAGMHGVDDAKGKDEQAGKEEKVLSAEGVCMACW